MPAEHYHVMKKDDLGTPEKRGGLIYMDLPTAADQFFIQCGIGSPALVMEWARTAHSRGQILRARDYDTGEAYAYLAICTLDACIP